MLDFVVTYEFQFVDDIIDITDIVLTLESDNYIDDLDLVEEMLLEKLKEEFGDVYLKIVDFEELKQTKQANLYRITADDVYYDSEYM